MERLLGFDLQLLQDAFITGINIFILFFVLSYFLFNPVRDYLEKRRMKIAGELEVSKRDKEAAYKLKAEYDKKLKMITKEADHYMEEARKKAKIREAEIMAEAKSEAERMVSRAYHEIHLERQKAMEELKQEVIDMASAMAGKLVAASVDASVHDVLIEETLKEIGESTWQS